MRPRGSGCPVENAVDHERVHCSKSPNLSLLRPKLEKKLATRKLKSSYLQSQESHSSYRVRDKEWPKLFSLFEHTSLPASSEHLDSYNAGPLV